MKIKITAPEKEGTKRTLNGVIVKPDSVHEVDANTARNLIKKGFATAADEEAKKLDLEERSTLSEDQADAQAEAIHDKRLEDKEKSDAKSTKKR